jgi:hypothetical protein
VNTTWLTEIDRLGSVAARIACALLLMNVRSLASPRRLKLPLLLASALMLAYAAPAAAVVGPPKVLDGPASTILDVDGAALAPDGTGGIVYRRLVDGLPHVYAVRYSNGNWSQPIRVDSAQPFAATFPTIAAGNGGRLLVVWATPWRLRADGKVHFQLMSSVMAPGSHGFGQAIEVDPDDIGDGSAAFPSLSMTPGGVAYVAYRVVTNPLDITNPAANVVQPMRPGDELVDVRVARFNGLTWSSLGAVNRLRKQVSMRKPTQQNAPVIATTRDGSGAVVTWQEPSIDGVARIWARRVFGTVPGFVLPISPSTIDGRPLGADADEPSLALSQFAEAKFGFRVEGGQGSPFGSPQLFFNALPPETDDRGGVPVGARQVDGSGSLGASSVVVDNDGNYRLAYTAGGEARLVTGDLTDQSAPASLGAASGDPAVVTQDPNGGGVTAWPATDGAGRPVVMARQDFDGGEWQLASLSAPLSGLVDGVSVGQDEQGDALVAFRQGSAEQSQVVASIANSRPTRFTATAPDRWVRTSAARVRWDAAKSAIGHVSYSVLLDGQVRASGMRARYIRFSSRGLGDGSHQVEVRAHDPAGQTVSASTSLRVDGNPPTVTVRRLTKRRVSIQVRDRASGVRVAPTRIVFGDASRALRGHKNARHQYKRRGRYVITVTSIDKVGNRGTWRVRVQVR